MPTINGDLVTARLTYNWSSKTFRLAIFDVGANAYGPEAIHATSNGELPLTWLAGHAESSLDLSLVLENALDASSSHTPLLPATQTCATVTPVSAPHQFLTTFNATGTPPTDLECQFSVVDLGFLASRPGEENPTKATVILMPKKSMPTGQIQPPVPPRPIRKGRRQ